MKFKYKSYGSDVLRPVIPIEITHKNLTVPYEVLVDSGADLCIFNVQIAYVLGIDLVKGIKLQVSGITGFPEDVYIHTVKVKIGGRRYKIDVGFIKMSNTSYGVVGQKGFFDIFVVKFDLVRREIDLKPRKLSSLLKNN